MKLTDGDSEILSMPMDTLLLNHQWPGAEFITPDVRQFLSEENAKLALVDSDDEDDIDQKPSIDFEDLLLNTAATPAATTTVVTNASNGATVGVPTAGAAAAAAAAVTNAVQQHVANNSLAELKPLPPFTGYTGHLSINGISGHHFHTIASAPNSTRGGVLIETNNNSVDTTNQNNVPYYPTDHVVSSSTMDSTIDSIKSENNALGYDIPAGEDLAALIGSAMADTTCATGDDSSDSWLDLDLWIGGHYIQSKTPTVSGRPAAGNTNSNHHHHNHHHSNHNNAASHNTTNVLCGSGGASNDALHDYVANTQFTTIQQTPPSHAISFHSQLKSQQPPTQPQQQSQPSSHHHSQQTQQQQREINTNFSHTMPLLQNRLQNGPPKAESQDIGGYNIVSECTSPTSSTQYLAHSPPCHVVSTTDIGFIQVHSSTRPSSELQSSFPHTTTPSKKSRSRTKSKMTSNIVYSDGNLGKEKTVHRCSICNRGFLNKSNIKVHLRTHTGEKPFRCEVCGKAFRQKAHLIKHAQIHKRVGRD